MQKNQLISSNDSEIKPILEFPDLEGHTHFWPPTTQKQVKKPTKVVALTFS